MAQPTPDQIFEAFLAASDEPSSENLDRLLLEHPEQASALRRLWRAHRQKLDALLSRAEEVYAAAQPPSGSVDLEGLCEAHPDLADELRRIEEERQVVEALEGGLHPAEDSISFFGRQEQEIPQPPPGLSEGQILGDYRLLRPIGQGGMGQVWEAEQMSLRRPVALKLVRPERVTARTLDLFAREARAGGRLNHPSIVSVYGYGEDGGIVWIAMELIEGSWTLRDFLDEVARREELPDNYYRDVAAFVAKLADALQAAHAASVIHRDLKPQNILVTPADEPKVTDFGLARITDESELSKTGDFAGTYYYMSPEQVAAKRIGLDHRTDVFSLGVVFYEMLALRRPFEGDTAQQIGYQIMQQDPPDLSTIRSRIPRDLAVICSKCLEKDRAHRYKTMAELAADLRRHLENGPIVAKPPGRLRKLHLWALRNPTKSAAGAVAGIAICAILFLLLQNLRTAAVARARAKEFDLLAKVTTLEALVERRPTLPPPRANTAAAYREWLDEANELVQSLDLIRSTLASLEARALAASAKELESDRQGHPRIEELGNLERRIASRRQAAAIRNGVAEIEPAELAGRVLQLDRHWLLTRAEDLLSPHRTAFGREAEAVALAERAIALGRTQDLLPQQIHHQWKTLAIALHEVGLDDEAAAAAVEANRHGSSDFDLGRYIDSRKMRTPTLDELETRRRELEHEVNRRRTWRFPDPRDRFLRETLAELVGNLELLDQTFIPQVKEKLDWAQQIEQVSIDAFRERWDEARRAIRQADGRTASILYAEIRFEIQPQIGLVPIGMNPSTKLWEFLHLRTALRGALPTSAAELSIPDPAHGAEPSGEQGVIFVLLPGGRFRMGTEEYGNYPIEIEPFFLSKYEMTQAQWARLTDGEFPSFNHEMSPADPWNTNLTVNYVSWARANEALHAYGLSIPTKAQWEYACRAGTTTSWYTGDSPDSLLGHANVCLQEPDGRRYWLDVGERRLVVDDIFATGAPSPIASRNANSFGLFDMHGNLREWCRDAVSMPHDDVTGPDAEHFSLTQYRGPTWRTVRGGSHADVAETARSGVDSYLLEGRGDMYTTVRPSRTVNR